MTARRLLVAAAALTACGELWGPAKVAVVGTVVDGARLPQAGVTVLVAGRDPVTTDADGRFALTEVTKPYDVTAVTSDGRAAVTYLGLSRSDPTLLLPVASFPASLQHSGDVNGIVTGGAGFPQPSNHRTAAVFLSPEAVRQGLVSGTSGSYRLSPQWLGPFHTVGSLQALQWEYDPASTLPVRYTGYGARTDATVTDGRSLFGQDLQLAPLGTGALTGSVTLPPGAILTGKSVALVIGTLGGGPALWALFQDTVKALDFSYAAPVVPGEGIQVSALATMGAARVEAGKLLTGASASGVAVALPPVVELGQPAEGAADVGAGTRLTWNRIQNAVYVIQLGSADAGPTYWIFTSDTTATILDLGASGSGLPAGAAYSWAVLALAPFGNLDQAAGPNNVAATGDWSTSVSATRHFTTAP
jgi:hypothetical protein